MAATMRKHYWIWLITFICTVLTTAFDVSLHRLHPTPIHVVGTCKSAGCGQRNAPRGCSALMMKVQPQPQPQQLQNTKLMLPQLMTRAKRMLLALPPLKKLQLVTPSVVKGFLSSLHPEELFLILSFRLLSRRLLRFAYRTQMLLWRLLKFNGPKDWDFSILGFVAGQCDRLSKAMTGVYIFKICLLLLVQLGLRVPDDFSQLVSRIVYLIYWGRFVDEFKGSFLCTLYPGLALPDNKRQRHMVNQFTTFAIATIVVLILSQMLANFFRTPLSSILALGGVGGIAVGLSARDVVANFLGGMMLLFNNPFSPSDMVTFKVAGMDVLGRVDRIGWTQTRIKTRETKSLYIPNSHFVQMPVVNNDRITHRKYEATVSIRLQDASRIHEVVQRIRDRLSNIPKLDKMSMPFRVHFAEINQFSLDIHMLVYFGTKSLDEYLQLQQTTNLEVIAAIEECGAQLAVPTTMLHIAGVSPDAVAAQAVPTAAAVKIGLVQNPSDSRSAAVATTATATTAATAAAASPETVMRQSVDAYMEEMMAREATMGSDPYVMKDDSVDFNIRVPAEPAPSAEDVASSAENRDLSTHNMFNSVAADVTGEMYGDDEEDDDDDLSESYGGDAESASPSVIDHRKSRERQAAGQPTASEEGAEPKTFSAKDAEQLYYAPGVWGNTLRRSGIMPDAHKIVSNQAVARDRIRGAVTDIRATEYPDSNLSPDDLDVLLDEEQDEESESSALRPHESSFVGTEEKRDKSELATAFWEDRDIRERSRRRDSASSSSGSALPRPEQQQVNTAIESHPQLPEREQLHGEVEELASVELDGLAENGAIIVKKICDVTDEDDFIDNKPSRRESSMVASDAEQQRIMGEMKQDDNDSNDESRNPDDEDDLFSGDHINSTL